MHTKHWFFRKLISPLENLSRLEVFPVSLRKEIVNKQCVEWCWLFNQAPSVKWAFSRKWLPLVMRRLCHNYTTITPKLCIICHAYDGVQPIWSNAISVPYLRNKENKKKCLTKTRRQNNIRFFYLYILYCITKLEYRSHLLRYF